MRGGQVGLSPIVELTDQVVRLGNHVVAGVDPVHRVPIVLASGEVFPQLFERLERPVHGLGIAVRRFLHLEMALAELELGVRRQDVHPVQVEEMLVLNDGFRIFLFLEEGLGPFHDDVGVIILLDRVAHENLFIRSAERLGAGGRRFGRTGTADGYAEDGRSEQEDQPRQDAESNHLLIIS